MFGWLRPRPPLGARKKRGGDSTPATLELLGGDHLQYVNMVLPTD